MQPHVLVPLQPTRTRGALQRRIANARLFLKQQRRISSRYVGKAGGAGEGAGVEEDARDGQPLSSCMEIGYSLSSRYPSAPCSGRAPCTDSMRIFGCQHASCF